MEPLEAMMQGLVQHWYNVASLSDDSKKTKDFLYEETERVVSLLTNEIREKALSKNEIWELCQPLRIGFDIKTNNESKKLAKWVARNTRDDGDGKFEGAYSIFRKLLTVVEEGYEDRTALPQSGMALIDSKSLRIIEANKRGISLSEEVAQELIYSWLSVEELKAMATDKASRNTAKNVLIHKINMGKIEIGCAEFPSIKSVVDFFGPRCSDITTLRFRFSSGSSIFPVIEQIDFNFLKYFLNLTALKDFSCRFITDFSVLQHCKNLVEVDLKNCVNLKDLSPLRDCTNLTILHLVDCEVLTDISALQHCKLTIVSFSDCNNLTDISALQHCKLTSLYLESCIALTDIRPLLDSPSISSSLRHLHLIGCRGVQEAFESLLKHFPNIVVLGHQCQFYRKK